MVVSREQELWAVALWVEKHHGENGRLHIAQQQDRLLAEGDLDGVAMWRKVGERFEALRGGVSDLNVGDNVGANIMRIH